MKKLSFFPKTFLLVIDAVPFIFSKEIDIIPRIEQELTFLRSTEYTSYIDKDPSVHIFNTTN